MESVEKYQITLPKGQAPRLFFELSESERQEIGRKIFQHVKELAAKVGAEPVTSQTLEKKRKKIRHSL